MIKGIVKRLIITLLVLTTTLIATEFKNKSFIGASVGVTKVDITYNKINGNFSSVSTLDEKGLNFGFELGEYLDDKTFITLSYNKIKFDNVIFDNYLVSYNKLLLKNKSYNIYVGLLGGVSFIKITSLAVDNLYKIDGRGKSKALGVQVGSEYTVDKNLKLFLQYQYLKSKHTTDLVSQSARANIVRENFSNMMCGIRWIF